MATTVKEYYTVDELVALKNLKAKDITLKITGNDKNEIEISIGKNIKNVNLYFATDNANTTTLYSYDVDNFTYQKDGKDLKITMAFKSGAGYSAKEQWVILKNYFTSASSMTTKSVIRNIKTDGAGDTIDTSTISDIVAAADITGATITYNPNKKGVVSGTPFGDNINSSEMNMAAFKNYGKKNKGLTINAGAGTDTITGTKYNDVISGGLGANIINFDYEKGFGLDIVKLTKGEVLTLNLTEGATPVPIGDEDLQYVKEGNHLVITNIEHQKDQIVLQNFFKTAATVSIGSDKITDYLTNGAGVLNIIGTKKIAGTDYGDYIVGSTAADTITSGKGKDEITAGLRNDTIKLGEGDKIVNIDYADGNDTITLASTNSLKLCVDDETGSPATNLVYAKSTNQKDLYIYRDNNQYTLIKNYYDANGNPTTYLTVNGNPVAADAVIYNLAKNNKLTIGSADGEATPGHFVLGSKNDNVTVNSGKNIINLLKGNDSVSFAAGYADDTVIKTAGGTDNVKFAGVAAENIDMVRDADGNIVITAGDDPHSTVTIKDFEDISSTVNVKDKDNKVVKTLKSGSGKLNGTKGDDIIVGSAKNDTITGGDGINEIYTRGGSDTVVIGNRGFNFINSTENVANAKVTLKNKCIIFG